jgi:hypothetical protein
MASRPTDRQLLDALRLTGSLLDEDCWLVGGSFHFRLDGPWSIAISTESAGRFRVAACHRATPVATLWCLAGDRDRLADLVLTARAEAQALVA